MQTLTFVWLAIVAVAAVAAHPRPVEETGGASARRLCEPGQTMMHDCNTCHCNDDGSDYLCTLMACAPKLPSATCEPGKSFKRYCNTCFCPPSGLRSSPTGCTLMACQPGVWAEDGTRLNPIQPVLVPRS